MAHTHAAARAHALIAILLATSACHHTPPRHPGEEYLEAIRFEGNQSVSSSDLRDGLALHRVQSQGSAPDPYLVTVDGDLRVRSVDHHDLDTARWECLDVDVTGLDDTDQVLSLVQQRFQEIPEERLTAVRVTLQGRTAAHIALWREREQMLHELQAAAGHHPGLWLEKLKLRTSGQDAAGTGTTGLLTDLRRTLSALGADPDGLTAKLSRHPLIGAIPPEIKESKGPYGIDPNDPAWLERTADEAFQPLESLLQEAW